MKFLLFFCLYVVSCIFAFIGFCYRKIKNNQIYFTDTEYLVFFSLFWPIFVPMIAFVNLVEAFKGFLYEKFTRYFERKRKSNKK